MTCNIPNISIQSITADPNFKKFFEYGGYAAEGIETAFGKQNKGAKNKENKGARLELNAN